MVRAFAPGRVNLLGEHTDHEDGLCLPFAIAAGVTVTVTDGPEDALRVVADDLGEEDAFGLSSPPPPAEGWRAFARGMAAELTDAGHRLRGGTVHIAGDLPRGGGLSSSAALEVALALALLRHAGAPEGDRRALARLCSRVEQDWVGAQTGLLDQLAVLLGCEGHAIRLDTRDLSAAPVALDLGAWRLVTVDSGVEHDHAGSGYNERRAECRAACEALAVAALRDATAEAAQSLPAPLDRRVRHVVSENARVDAGVEALQAGDLEALGRLLDASHASLRDDFEVSVPEIDDLVERLRAGGAAGARIVGGGFGGSALALLPPGADPPAGALEVRPSGPARVLEP